MITDYRDLFGRSRRYLKVFPSAKVLARARAKLRELTDRRRQSFVPVVQTVVEVSRWMASWENYFRHRYPSEAFRELNWYAEVRLRRHLQRRSQRPFRIPEGVVSCPPSPAGFPAAETKTDARLTRCACFTTKNSGKPDAGNPPVRFE